MVFYFLHSYAFFSFNIEYEVMVAHGSASCQALAAGIYLKEGHILAEGGEAQLVLLGSAIYQPFNALIQFNNCL